MLVVSLRSIGMSCIPEPTARADRSSPLLLLLSLLLLLLLLLLVVLLLLARLRVSALVDNPAGVVAGGIAAMVHTP